MFSKNVFFSAAICIICSACAPTKSSSEVTILSPGQENLADVENQLNALQKKRDYCKARLYADTDEAMRTEFDCGWETYQGNLSKQEYTSERLKTLNAQIADLEKKKEALQNKKVKP